MKRLRLLIVFFFFGMNGLLFCQFYSGRVVDIYTKEPLAGAEIKVQGKDISITADNQGQFSYYVTIPPADSNRNYEIEVVYNRIYWRTNKFTVLNLFTILGQQKLLYILPANDAGEIDLEFLTQGIYLLNARSGGRNEVFRVLKTRSSVHFSKSDTLAVSQFIEKTGNGTETDTLIISKAGYYPGKFAYIEEGSDYELLKTGYDDIDYLNTLVSPEAFSMLEGLPLSPVFGEVKSVKIIYSIPDDKIYYTNSERYRIHYDFASRILGYSKGHGVFNQEQYTTNPNRIYYLASLNYFTSSGIYTLEFFPGDEADCDAVSLVYQKIAGSSFIGSDLRFYPNSPKWNLCSGVSRITSDELYAGQNYQPLNPQANYGYLKKVTVDEVGDVYLGKHDIVLLNGIPIDIPVVAGIITTEFQAPLSHINVLSHNRGTPNMALRDGWTNPRLTGLLDNLVYLQVSLDSFHIRAANLQEAETFWAIKEPNVVQKLALDTITDGLIEIDEASVNSVSLIGGKASNFAELTKVNVTNYGPLPIPEGSFAIPFYYYWEHMRNNGLQNYLEKMLNDPLFKENVNVRKQQLLILRDSIKKCPVDDYLVQLVRNKIIASSPGYKNMRFRSSTNAEDVAGFNGAGLYDSYTGILDDNDKPIDMAIKKVWASLWNFDAYEEREYFKIDHKTVAMGILVHRSFPAEAANGVVITKNLYNEFNSAITINVQIGEISIVNPEENFLPDQVIYYNYPGAGNTFEYISHSTVPGMEGKTVMTEAELTRLKDFCMAIHYHYCRINNECVPLDIEFKVDLVNGQRKIYVKQAREY